MVPVPEESTVYFHTICNSNVSNQNPDASLFRILDLVTRQCLGLRFGATQKYIHGDTPSPFLIWQPISLHECDPEATGTLPDDRPVEKIGRSAIVPYCLRR